MGRYVRSTITDLGARPVERISGSQCVEGCYVEPLHLVPQGELARDRRYVALLAPAGGATCSGTAEVLVAFPIDPFDALAALFEVDQSQGDGAGGVGKAAGVSN